jgi:hypothetical protein
MEFDPFCVAERRALGPSLIIKQSTHDLGLNSTVGASHELQWYTAEDKNVRRKKRSTFVVVPDEEINGNVALGPDWFKVQNGGSDLGLDIPGDARHETSPPFQG